MNKLGELYCDVDSFCKVFIPQWQQQLLQESTQKQQQNGQPVEELTKALIVKLYGDKDYLSRALEVNVFDKVVALITSVDKKMKTKLISSSNSVMLDLLTGFAAYCLKGKQATLEF